MKILQKLLLVASILYALPQADAALLTYWNFNNDNPVFNSGSSGLLGSLSTSGSNEVYTTPSNSASGTLASNNTNGTVFNGSAIKIDFSNIDTISSPTINGKTPTAYITQNATSGAAGFGTFTGSTTNAVGSDVAGDSLLLLNTSGNMINKYITFSLSSVGYNALSLSYAVRLTSAVTASEVWTYSLDGTTFFSLGAGGISPTADGSFKSASLNLSTLSSNAVDNQSAFYLRMTYNSANAQGSTALDNIQLTGTAIPEPSTWAMLIGGLGVLLGYQRRRRA